MHRETMITLEYDKVKERLAEFAVSDLGKKRIYELEPSINKAVIETWLTETTEARAIVDRSSSVPLHSLARIEDITGKLGKGMTLTPGELTQICGLLGEGKKLKRFMKDKDYVAPMVSSYVLSFSDLDDLAEEIERCIRGGLVDDKASPELGKIRKKSLFSKNGSKANWTVFSDPLPVAPGCKIIWSACDRAGMSSR